MQSAMFPARTMSRPPSALQHMSIAGLAVSFHTPVGARSDFSDGIEKAQRLPPYAPRNVYAVNDFAGVALAEWPRSAESVGVENVASYFAGVKAGQGMWFDFNCMNDDTHHVAIVPSVQGVNPITGRAGSLGMEQYTQCPVHNMPFLEGRHCTSCGYKWPKQNYLATTGTPRGVFWLDGFRQSDGRVRQWLFTEDQERGVATHVLGGSRQYAVAFAVYRSVAPKPAPRYNPVFPGVFDSDLIVGGHLKSMGMRSFGTRSATQPLEVAAGALINQFVYDDPHDLVFWSRTPVGIIMLNYVNEDMIAEIVTAAGMGHNEGSLTGVPVGNP